jgi:hypothetical protein
MTRTEIVFELTGLAFIAVIWIAAWVSTPC